MEEQENPAEDTSTEKVKKKRKIKKKKKTTRKKKESEREGEGNSRQDEKERLTLPKLWTESETAGLNVNGGTGMESIDGKRCHVPFKHLLAGDGKGVSTGLVPPDSSPLPSLHSKPNSAASDRYGKSSPYGRTSVSSHVSFNNGRGSVCSNNNVRNGRSTSAASARSDRSVISFRDNDVPIRNATAGGRVSVCSSVRSGNSGCSGRNVEGSTAGIQMDLENVADELDMLAVKKSIYKKKRTKVVKKVRLPPIKESSRETGHKDDIDEDDDDDDDDEEDEDDGDTDSSSGVNGPEEEEKEEAIDVEDIIVPSTEEVEKDLAEAEADLEKLNSLGFKDAKKGGVGMSGIGGGGGVGGGGDWSGGIGGGDGNTNTAKGSNTDGGGEGYGDDKDEEEERDEEEEEKDEEDGEEADEKRVIEIFKKESEEKRREFAERKTDLEEVISFVCVPVSLNFK